MVAVMDLLLTER